MPRFFRAFFTIATFFIALFLIPTGYAFAYESIPHFHSDITIQQRGSLHIRETLSYTTDEPRHGIYRTIPLRYTWKGVNVRTALSQLQVRDITGANIPFSTQYRSNDLLIKIGDPETTFLGQKTYILEYNIENALQELRDTPQDEPHIELYWDITGEGWQVPLGSSSATLTSPFAAITRSSCFSGTFGGNDGKCQVQSSDSSTLKLLYPETISYGDNFTIALELERNAQLQLPGIWEKRWRVLRDNGALALIPLPGIIMLLWWWKKGRDWSFFSWNVFANDEKKPQQRAVPWSARGIPMVYEPITELTPGQASTLLHQSVSVTAIVSEIIDLARKKYIRIERSEKKQLFGTKAEYTLTQLKPADAHLPDHQRYLQQQLFSGKTTVTLTELKGTFWKTIAELQKRMLVSLVENHYFERNPATMQAIGLGVGGVLHVPTGILAFSLLEQGQYWGVPFLILSGVVSTICALALPARTAVGHNHYWQVRGLRRTLQNGAWREKVKEKHLFIEEVLPFAVALGVVKQLARDMEALNLKPPEYFAGSHGLQAWSTAQFVQSFTNEANATLGYNPNASSHSSGSGFSGGFSGGGGGGGGGGSW